MKTQEQLLERAWAANAHAIQAHTWEAWEIAADAFEEAGRPDISRQIRRTSIHLKVLSRRELLAVATLAAERAMRGRRASERTFQRGRDAAWKALMRTRHGRLYSHQLSAIARRGTALARSLVWTSGGRASAPSPDEIPKWRGRL